MKNLKSLVILLIIVTSLNITAQYDSSHVFLLPEFTLYYKNTVNINEFRFDKFELSKICLNDTLLSSNPKTYNFSVKVLEIKRISFRSGSHFWTGAAILGGLGFAFGFFVGGNGMHGYQPFRFDAALGVGLISSIPTGLIGGLIGLIFPKYDNYYFDELRKERKADFIRNIFFEYEVKGL